MVRLIVSLIIKDNGGKWSLAPEGAAVGSVAQNQIGHNPETGESEAIMMLDFDNPVSNLIWNCTKH